MLIGIITDTHYGIRGDSTLFLDNNKLFLDNVFFPILHKNKINTVIHLGDLVDRRKYINYNTFNRLREDFLEPLRERDIKTYIIAGNHDCFYKNTNDINALKEIIGNSTSYKNIEIYDRPKEIKLDNDLVLLLPWICDDNREETYKFIKESNAKICMGHLELVGFQMYKGSFSIEGDDPKDFSKFDIVLSGHYHHRSNDSNIYYLGSHSEFTWSDYNDPRGFHIFDTETRKLQFFENPYKVFKKIYYKDSEKDIHNIDVSNSIVKVIIQSKNDPFIFDKFIDNLEKQNPVELQVVEDHLNLSLEEDDNIINEAESTLDIFKKYIHSNNFNSIDKNQLEKIIIDLYHEALSIE